jgi:hypothetical protein
LDGGTQSSGGFWQQLYSRLGIQSQLNTEFHPQTDGQKELINALLAKYIQSYVSHEQHDWSL